MLVKVQYSDDLTSKAANLTSIQDIWLVNFLGNTLKFPYYHNYSLHLVNPNLERAVIIIHGTNRNAKKSYQNILNAAHRAGVAEQNTLIIAPQFLNFDELERFALPENYLYWSESGWKSGHLSQAHARPFRYSSYSIIDDFVKTLAKQDLFPNLQEIVIAGHSAGGQFVNRYAAGSLVQPDGIHLKYVIANPSSYLYLDARRVIEGTLTKFAFPERLAGSICPNFNQYKYGLENLPSYMKKAALDTIRSQYAQRDVIYLLGSEDRDPNCSYLANNCRAMLQGAHRLERGLIFYKYLEDFYGYQPHTQIIVPGVGHNARAIFNSPEAIKVFFRSR